MKKENRKQSDSYSSKLKKKQQQLSLNSSAEKLHTQNGFLLHLRIRRPGFAFLGHLQAVLLERSSNHTLTRPGGR